MHAGAGCAHLEARLALEGPALRIDDTVIVQHVDELQAVPLASGKIVGVVRGSDLHRTRACGDTNHIVADALQPVHCYVAMKHDT